MTWQVVKSIYSVFPALYILGKKYKPSLASPPGWVLACQHEQTICTFSLFRQWREESISPNRR